MYAMHEKEIFLDDALRLVVVIIIVVIAFLL
jgi:hypothetical protein